MLRLNWLNNFEIKILLIRKLDKIIFNEIKDLVEHQPKYQGFILKFKFYKKLFLKLDKCGCDSNFVVLKRREC